VRTAAQDLWSALEHHLGYKPPRRTRSAAKTQLQILGRTLSTVDEHFNFLYEELNQYRESESYRNADPLTAEILPAVLGEAGIICAQRDVNNILKFLYSRGVETVGDFLELATPRRLELIRNTYLSTIGRQPVPLDVTATLAAIRGSEDQAEEERRIQLQIEYRGAWDEIRQEFVKIGNE
jgi:putative GTP pyrophosphokinase